MRTNQNKTIAEVLRQIDSKQVFDHYLSDYHNYGDLKKGDLFSNPFLNHKQKTPSFNIYPNKYGEWRYKDFATDDRGSKVDLVMRLFTLNFVDAVTKIANDLNLV